MVRLITESHWQHIEEERKRLMAEITLLRGENQKLIDRLLLKNEVIPVSHEIPDTRKEAAGKLNKVLEGDLFEELTDEQYYREVEKEMAER